jgi:hypothetical protein
MTEFNWPTPVEAEMHIRAELNRLGMPFKEDHNSFRIVCPFPHPGDGVNTKRNRGIKKDGTTSFCFVCRNTGSWQKIAPMIGAAKFGGTGLLGDDAADFNLAAAIRGRMARMALNDTDDEHEVPEGMKPWVGSWRGLSEAFLRAVNAHHWYQSVTTENGHFTTERIWFPCIQWNEYVGYVSRRLDKRDEMRYYNAPWMKSSEVLFPFDYARTLGGDRIVLVEGPVDALKLLHGGVPAVAVLGTNNMGSKESLLSAAGYKKAFVLFDSDQAGREAAPVMRKKLLKVMDCVDVVNLPPTRKDPGELEPAEVRWLLDYIRQ